VDKKWTMILKTSRFKIFLNKWKKWTKWVFYSRTNLIVNSTSHCSTVAGSVCAPIDMTCLIRKAISWPCSTTGGICLANYFVTIRGSVVNQTSNDCDVVCTGPATLGVLNLEGWNDSAISSNSLKCQWPLGALSMPFARCVFPLFIVPTNLLFNILYIYCVKLE